MSQSHVHTDKLPEPLSHDGALVLSMPTWIQERTALLTLLLESAVGAQQLRTRQEQAMLQALLDASPTPCSYATLYAACMGIRAGDAQVFIEGVRKGEGLNMACSRYVRCSGSANSSSNRSTSISGQWMEQDIDCFASGSDV